MSVEFGLEAIHRELVGVKGWIDHERSYVGPKKLSLTVAS